MIFLDSSALVKLVVREPETAALRTWLTAREGQPWGASSLVRVEVVRACRRLAPSGVPIARALLTGVDLVPLSGQVLDVAADLADPLLRSLDAIQLASAVELQEELTAFVVYDHRLAQAAIEAGLPVVRPS